MKLSLIETPQFKDEVKRLSKKYRRIESDLRNFHQELLKNPSSNAVPIPSFEQKIWKARMGSSDMQRGKSGGFRLIFYYNNAKPDKVYLLTIYPKTERGDISSKELIETYQRFIRFFKG